MFTMQVEIASRGANLLAPGGQLVVSTCSVDPVENEAVVAELLRRCPHLELLEITDDMLPGLVLHNGLTAWDMLDEKGHPVTDSSWSELHFFDASQLSPSDRVRTVEDVDQSMERTIETNLPKCKRLWHNDHDS